ncbi:unnamed protein product [Alternaria alternata]
MTKVQNPPLFGCAMEAFVEPKLNTQHAVKRTSVQNTASGTRSTLFTLAAIKRYGHFTPPEELSPTDLHQSFKRSSTSRKQSMDEAPWPKQHMPSQSSTHRDERPIPTRRYTMRQPTVNGYQAHASSLATQQESSTTTRPLKRKRGRPELHTTVSHELPFHVSSTRQSHVAKNRVAARKYRNRKTEYISSLEDRARGFSSKNKVLRGDVAMLHEEVLDLKNEVLFHAACGAGEIDGYLEQCAYEILGMEVGMRNDTSTTTPHSNERDHSRPATMSKTNQRMEQRHDNSTDAMIRRRSTIAALTTHRQDSSEGFQLLRDDFGEIDVYDEK